MQVADDDSFPVFLKRTVFEQARQHDIIVVARVPLRDRRVKEHRLPPGQTEHGRGRDGEHLRLRLLYRFFLLNRRICRFRRIGWFLHDWSFLRQRDFPRFLPRQLRNRAPSGRHDEQQRQNDTQNACALLFR